jgi:Ca-activated chloride channel family protein
LLARTLVLLRTWDERKEFLYEDVRKLFDAYPTAQPTSSWYVSGKALQRLTDLDHDALFKAKAFYLGGQTGSATAISTEDIDGALRDVIAKEYQNMKGIEKYGRSNGLCPYTPYEDLPVASKKLSEDLNPLRTGKGSGYQHPYYNVLYSYNEVVRQYNKFCELSAGVFLLPTVQQPQLFELDEPKGSETPEATPSSASASRPPVAAAATTSTVAAIAVQSGVSAGASNAGQSGSLQQTTSHGEPATVAAASTQKSPQQKMLHDTVYIERRDTVYLSATDENLRSMEGYAINHLVLLLDVSGSMNAPEKLPLLKSSVMQLVSMMRVEDKVSIIAFSDKPKVLLTATSFKDVSQVEQAINALKSSGKTDGNAGVKLAYKVADENYLRGGNNRIILATDGEFGLNDATRDLIRKFSTEDIFLSIFNFGKGAGASRALEQVAQMGKGNYQYISKENVELQLIREAKAKRAR